MADSLTLAAENLVCRRGGREVFSGLSFKLSSGQALAVTGRNGAGKSSLLRMLAGLLRIEGGRLALNIFNPSRVLFARARGDGNAVTGESYRGLRVRYVLHEEMEALLRVAGFVVESLHGGFSGEPFADGSPEQVWVARRAG